MNDLTAPQAFHALRELLATPGADSTWTCKAAPALDRLRVALVDPQSSDRDLVVLLRQALSFERWRRGKGTSPTVTLGGHQWASVSNDAFSRSGLDVRGGAARVVHLQPWRPEWLTVTPTQGVEDRASGEEVCRKFDNSNSEPDPYLSLLGLNSYRTKFQKNAIRSALLTPPGATLVVRLATGEGKSTIPQALAVAGFDARGAKGAVVVIEPTVTLTADQELAAAARGFIPPTAYRSEDHVSRATILAKLQTGEQQLLFCSPESACQSLRWPLLQAAAAGHISALIIDEAHLVDAWGTGFRTEFQLLSSLRRELIAASPKGREPRTILMSATLTESAVDTLRGLFTGPGSFEVFTALRIRPEPDYWVADVCSEDRRGHRIDEALDHVPRPAILYVSKVSDAIDWRARLQARGFRRVRSIHGKTSNTERDAVIRDWRDGRVDVVVATSAFGMGIDYAHVRSVIHACVPESIDRFYQEVGRGGRDGRACLSIVVPAYSDIGVAESISDVTVISTGRGRQRWQGMFSQKQPVVGTTRYRVPLAAPPGNDESDLDMVGERSMDWNARTLMLMQRARLIQLHGMQAHEADSGPWQEVELLEPGHLREADWFEKVEPLRASIRQSASRNLALMSRYLEKIDCPTRLLMDLYGGDTGRQCATCFLCRKDVSCQSSPTPVTANIPWRGVPPTVPLIDLFDSSGRILVLYQRDKQGNARWLRRLGGILEFCLGAGVRNLSVIHHGEATQSITSLLKGPWFIHVTTRLQPGALPPGPEIVLSLCVPQLSAANLDVRQTGSERIFLLPEETEAPGRPGTRLGDCFAGRTLHFDELFGALSR